MKLNLLFTVLGDRRNKVLLPQYFHNWEKTPNMLIFMVLGLEKGGIDWSLTHGNNCKSEHNAPKYIYHLKCLVITQLNRSI